MRVARLEKAMRYNTHPWLWLLQIGRSEITDVIYKKTFAQKAPLTPELTALGITHFDNASAFRVQ